MILKIEINRRIIGMQKLYYKQFNFTLNEIRLEYFNNIKILIQ